MTTDQPLTATADTAALDDLRRRASEPDAVRALLAERVGVARDADPETIMAALDRALAERPYAGPPEGSELVDVETMNALRRDAEAGRVSRHERLVSDAVARGKITPAGRANWLLLLETDPGAEQALARIKPNTAVPIAPIGYSDANEERDNLYSAVYGP